MISGKLFKPGLQFDGNNSVWVVLQQNLYSKTCVKRNAIVPVFFSVFTGFRFIKGCVLKYKKYDRLGLQ
jgi:hypothetical protein